MVLVATALAACGGARRPEAAGAACAEGAPETGGSPARQATLTDLRASGPLARLSWLAGEWESWDPDDGRCTTEQWMTPAGSSMLGSNRTVEGDRTVAWETLRIEARGDGVVYVADPSGQAVTEFRLVDAGVDTHGADYAVFENPEHDFPVRIRYTLRDETLTARIEGREPDRAAEWSYHRIDRSRCPPPPADALSGGVPPPD